MAKTTKSTRHALLYWRPRTVIPYLETGQWRHYIGSDQIQTLAVRDVVWLVTVLDGRLILLNRFPVGRIIAGQASAERLLGPNIWKASYYAVPGTGPESDLQRIDAMSLAHQLRFDSKNADALKITDHQVNPQQLQTMRWLTADSVRLLEELWSGYMRANPPTIEPLAPIPKLTGAGFSTDEVQSKRVELAAVKIAKREYEEEGWSIISVERGRVGYDLKCHRTNGELHVEVKGVAGDKPDFIMTSGELTVASEDPLSEILVVTNALSRRPLVHRFPGAQLRVRYKESPIAYKLVLRNQSK